MSSKNTLSPYQFKTSGLVRAILTLIILTLLLSACNLPFQDQSNDGLGSILSLPTKVPPTPTITPTPQPKARITIGEQDILNGDYDSALNEFWLARSQSTDPEVIATAQLGVGRVLLMKSDYRGAMDQLNWLLVNFAEGEQRNTAFFFLAKAYEALGEYQPAADAYAAYLSALPGALDSDIREMQGDALMKAENPAAAKPIFDQAYQTATADRKESIAIKAAQAASAAGDDNDAIARYLNLYESSSTDYIKAQVNLLLGQIYLRLEMPEQAYARFQDSVRLYPTSYDTYSGLVALVNAGQPVSDLMRGIVDYYAEQYGVAVEALDRYMNANSDHDGTPHYFKAQSLWNMGEYDLEIAEWDKLIADHPTDQYFPRAFLEKSSSQWRYLEDYQASAQTLLNFVARVPDAPEAPDYLYTAGSIYEIGGYLSKASKTWQRVFNEYPGAEKAYPALFESGIVTYRLKKYVDAQVIFQRLLVLATTPEDLAAANLWAAKCFEKQGKTADAQTYFQQAAAADPTGYYSIRAQEILNGQQPFPSIQNIDLAVDFEKERVDAVKWMRSTFGLDASVNISDLADLVSNPLFQRGETFWKLDMRDLARAEFETLRVELQSDAVSTFRLMNYLVDHGFYQSAARASRQVLDLAGVSQADTLTRVPIYFNHIRFGVFFRDIVINSAVEHDIDPLLLFSIIRQESLFDPSVTSSQDAHGLMQITGDTGDYIASNFNWPPNYSSTDLDRPVINVRLGAHYLKYWLDRYDGSVPTALGSYNAGDGNNLIWVDLAGGDTDLYLELIRFDETRDYIRYIAENYAIYKSIYTHK